MRSSAEALAALLPARRGHFRYESGHHGDLWLDLPRLYRDPGAVRRFAEQLAERLRPHRPEAVCGPLVEGAFVALQVAESLSLPFSYSERFDTGEDRLFPVRYRVPDALRDELRGRRMAVVNDVVNAGSAVGGTLDDLAACAARPVAIATLAVLGERAEALAAERGVALEALLTLPHRIQAPGACDDCARGVPLEGEPAPRRAQRD
jgi:orotate phosphoribosyltransferase